MKNKYAKKQQQYLLKKQDTRQQLINKINIEIETLNNDIDELNKIVNSNKNVNSIKQLKTQLKKIKSAVKKIKINKQKVSSSVSIGSLDKKSKNFYKGLCTTMGKSKVDDLLKMIMEKLHYNQQQALDWIFEKMGATSEEVTNSFYDKNQEEEIKQAFFDLLPESTEYDFEKYIQELHKTDYRKFINNDLFDNLKWQLYDEV